MAVHALVHNPVSGRGRSRHALDRIRAAFRGVGDDVVLLPTRAPGGGETVAASAARACSGEGHVLVLGGDGTANEVAWGLARAGLLQDGPALGILPGGSTNVVARSLGLPRDPGEAAAVLRRARPRALDLGWCETDAGPRPFLLACGVGYDAEVVARVSGPLKRRIGRQAYAVAGLLNAGGRPCDLRVRLSHTDGRREEAVAASVLVGNSRFFGGAIRLLPDASMEDGQLELVLLPSTRLLPLLRAAIAGQLTDMSRAPGVRVARVVGATIEGARPVACHVDAEPWGRTPARVSVRPRAIRLLVPLPS